MLIFFKINQVLAMSNVRMGCASLPLVTFVKSWTLEAPGCTMRGPPIFFPCNSFKKYIYLQRRLFRFCFPGVNSKNKSFVRKIARGFHLLSHLSSKTQKKMILAYLHSHSSQIAQTLETSMSKLNLVQGAKRMEREK